MPIKPAHYEFEKIEFGQWSLLNPGLENLHHSKYPDYAAKLLYSYGGKLIYEFLHEGYDQNNKYFNKARVEFEPRDIVSVRRDGAKFIVATSGRKPKLTVGDQGSESTAAERARGYNLKTSSRFRKEECDFSYGHIVPCRSHTVTFSSEKRCEHYAARFTQLDPRRFSHLLDEITPPAPKHARPARLARRTNTATAPLPTQDSSIASSSIVASSVGARHHIALRSATTRATALPGNKRAAAAAMPTKHEHSRPAKRHMSSQSPPPCHASIRQACRREVPAQETDDEVEEEEEEEGMLQVLRDYAEANDMLGCRGSCCDGCQRSLKGLIICPRCYYTACSTCQRHRLRGDCYCRASNFGVLYTEEQLEQQLENPVPRDDKW